MSGFKEGELIICSKPYAYVLNNACRGKFCDYCFRENDKLEKCGQCGFLHYCDKNCQKKAWEMHETECNFIKGRELPDPTIRLCILVIMRVKKNGYEVPCEEFGNRKATIASLMSHAEDFKKERFERVMQAVIQTAYYIGTDNMPPFDEFVEIYGKIATNAFSIYSISDKVGGLGLYLGPSFFDHSCDADAAYTFDGTTLNVRMMRSVAHRDVSQVRVSYLKEISLKEERAKLLWESKFLVCSCTICTSPTPEELLTKLVSDEPEIKEKAMKCKEEVEELVGNSYSDDPQLRYVKCKKLLDSQSRVLADTNVYRIKTLQMAFNVSFSLGKVDEAVKFASDLENPYRMHFCKNHPKLGRFFVEYGTNLFVLGRHQEALSKLSEAMRILKVTHGENHSVILNLNNVIQRCLDFTKFLSNTPDRHF